MGISERGKELKRRRHRKKKLAKLKVQFDKARPSERPVIFEKVRNLTPGGTQVLLNWGVEPEEIYK